MYAKTLLSAVAACGFMAQAVNAHIVITSPVPYGKDSLTNSPLENDGSDFPCKQRPGVYDISTMNNIAVGVPQNLSFMGGATHGGGSCQVSVTMDKEPTQNSEWRVIHTILGGCPNSVAGNAADVASYQGNPSFEYTMPKGMPNGQYTLAWTWFNKIGNREMYMNCAPITVTGGADDNDVLNTLPYMYVNNIPNEQCSTIEGEDFDFPDPGLYVETYKSTALSSSTTGAACASVTAKGRGTGTAGTPAVATGAAGASGSGSAPVAAASASSPAASAASGPGSAQGSAASASSPAAAAAVTQSADDSIPAQNVVTITTMVSVMGSASAAANVPSASAASGSDSSSSGSSSGTTSSGSCPGSEIACQGDGSVVCIGSNQWGMCNAGCAVPMALAAGTSCSGGTISKRHDVHLGRHLARAPKH